jgi:hypothetical protein
MKSMRILLLALLSTGAAGLATPAFANSANSWGLNDSQEPGSVLVFYRFDAGSISTPDEGTIAKTQFKISVTCPTNLGPNGCKETGDFATGQPVFLKAHWVCPPQDTGTTCQELDFPLSTTVYGTVEFDANGGEDLPKPPCKNGYLIVWVEDITGTRISFNGLIGSAVLRGSGTSWRAYNALSISSPQPSFADPVGPMHFDGTEYQAITGTIYGTVAYPNSENTRLTLLTLDVLSNQPNEATVVDLNFYNEEEFFISTAASFTCWGEFRLSDLAGGNLANSPFTGWDGLVRSTRAMKGANPSVTVVGLVETEEHGTQGISPGTCQQAAATFTQVAATCTVAANVITAACTTQCANVCPGVGLPGIVECSVCQRLCVTTTSAACTAVNGAVTPANGLCQVINATTSVDFLREYAYPLLNDSIPVSTTFVP